jgi:hypothetical protein
MGNHRSYAQRFHVTRVSEDCSIEESMICLAPNFLTIHSISYSKTMMFELHGPNITLSYLYYE